MTGGVSTWSVSRLRPEGRLRRAEELDAMPPAQIQALIFAPGFSTSPLVTDISGRGVGLDVVYANVERLKGNIQVESVFGHG